MQVTVDIALCEGHGVCVLAAPTVFDLDDQDDLIVLDEHPSEDTRDAVSRAVTMCPKRAIVLVD